jgi:error-prone DNA polymerase
MTAVEVVAADLWATGVTSAGHPFAHARAVLDRRGVLSAAALVAGADRGAGAGTATSKVTVAGIVTHRQRPSTAGGAVFVNLEDETGVVNVVCSLGCWTRYRRIASSSPALVVRGRAERSRGAVTVVAERIEALELPFVPARARDFR